MNYIWSGLFILSFLFAAPVGNLQETLTAGLSGAASSIEVLMSFAGIMCFWSGILNIAKKSGAAHFSEKLLSPIIRRLFPTVKDRTDITMNMVANLLGMGNAATPAGISAMRGLDAENNHSPHPSRAMCRFVVLNTTCLQLFPTTVIGILTACGSEDPFSVILPIWISSFFSLSVALLAERLLPKGR